MRIDSALRHARAAGLDRADSEILLAAASGRSRTQLLAYPEWTLDQVRFERFESWIRRRLDHEPVAYLLGRQEFHGLQLEVDAAVLVPRPETELLVEFALDHGSADGAIQAADLGTGSGAIAIAIAAARPNWRICAVDRSTNALELARGNAVRLELPNIEFLSGDWFAPLGDRRFDLLLSNPPYLAADDPHLEQLRHEPWQALVAGSDGLECLRVLCAGAPKYLKEGGWIALEHGWDQAEAVRGLLRTAGFVAVESVRDLAGIERIGIGRWCQQDPDRSKLLRSGQFPDS